MIAHVEIFPVLVVPISTVPILVFQVVSRVPILVLPEFDITGAVFVVPVLVSPVELIPELISIVSELVLPESNTTDPVFVVPVLCHPEVPVAQDPDSVVPVFEYSVPVLASPIELVPVLVVPVLFSIGRGVTLQPSSVVVR